MLCGCGEGTPPPEETAPAETAAAPAETAAPASETVTEAQAETEPVTEADPPVIYYITDHGTVDPSAISLAAEVLTGEDGIYLTGAAADVPEDAKAVILNAPQEDITSEELKALDVCIEGGCTVVLLLPANGEELRLKYIERLTEEFSVQTDYDLVTDETRTEGEGLISLDQIGPPEGMNAALFAASAQCMNNVRSFHFVRFDGFDNIRQDALLECTADSVGTPFGGVQDDPETFTDECLVTMLYARDVTRQNGALIAAGSSDFLLDVNAETAAYQGTRAWLLAAVQWMMQGNFY